MQKVEVRFLILKFGKILLLKNREEKSLEIGKWILPGGELLMKENLKEAVNRILHEKSGWRTKDIRLFKLATFTYAETELHEIIFIVEAIDKLPHQIEGNRWFTLSDLPSFKEIDSEHTQIIKAFKDLVHKGKTLDLESLPPSFDLKDEKKIRQLLLQDHS